MEWIFKHCFQPIHNILDEMGNELTNELSKILSDDEHEDSPPIIIKMDKNENVRKRIVLENPVDFNNLKK